MKSAMFQILCFAGKNTFQRHRQSEEPTTIIINAKSMTQKRREW